VGLAAVEGPAAGSSRNEHAFVTSASFRTLMMETSDFFSFRTTASGRLA
jgi:hypothetical protein